MYPQNLHWQLRVSPGPVAAWDEAVTGIEDLEQAIRIICLTPKLSVPTEPEKFCDALEFIDRPPAIAIPRISQEIWDGLTRWEPRIAVEKVEVDPVAFHHFKVPIFWRPREDVLSDIRRTVVELQGVA
ncbi:baseplate [Labrenzia sp. R4_2]|uniref:baseplate n=1 Tax=Labrenzia sp. R4_2 TaxID=2821107 RepID=UPI001ADAC47E|nr:baseplate [Labrenzia sp. R4_2]MBO9421697.1 baseplate [Labrenzia sp. R4_2]